MSSNGSEPLSSIKHVLAIAAGKGGVGKSTVAAHLAFALKSMGFAVGILDADIYGPSMRKLLPEERMPVQKGEMIIPALSYGMPVISMAYFRREDEASAVRAPIANSIVQQFVKNVAWGPLDWLLIDFPPGTGDIQLTLSQQAHLKGAVMVTTPQDLAVMDVRKAMHLFEHVNVPIVGIVENMSFLTHPPSGDRLYPFGEGGGERLARESGVPFLGQIPLDGELCRSCDRGEPLFKDQQAGKEAAAAFQAAAEQIVQHVGLIDANAGAALQEFDLEWKEMAAVAIFAPQEAAELRCQPVPRRNDESRDTCIMRNKPAGLVKKIWQVDNHHFSIQWSDEGTSTFRLSALQEQCPCAGCVEARKGSGISVDPQVRALRISSVGRYALRIKFSNGCSAGIFDFSQLRALEQESPCKKTI